jgi:TetR/AcrR family transcriptional regulator, cholesterol catabolism regulator
MTFKEFNKRVMVTVENLCRDFYRENRELFKTKKEAVAVKNLTAIVTSALKLSFKKGFDAMSLRDLSGESGLSMGALYSYFKSKEELLGMIQRQGQAAVEKILREHIETESDPAQKLRNAIRAHLYLSETMKSWFYFFFMETKNLNQTYRKISVENELMTERLFTTILEDGVSRGVFTVDNIHLTGSVIKAMMQDWYLKQWKYAQRNVSVEDYAQFVINVVESFIITEKKEKAHPAARKAARSS